MYVSWHGANPFIPEKELMATCIISLISAEPYIAQCIHLTLVEILARKKSTRLVLNVESNNKKRKR